MCRSALVPYWCRINIRLACSSRLYRHFEAMPHVVISARSGTPGPDVARPEPSIWRGRTGTSPTADGWAIRTGGGCA
jgi:hypothetical protein